MKACLSGQPVEPSSKEISNLVDHRYFYDKYDPEDTLVGCYTCGLARNAVATELHANKVGQPILYCPLFFQLSINGVHPIHGAGGI